MRIKKVEGARFYFSAAARTSINFFFDVDVDVDSGVGAWSRCSLFAAPPTPCRSSNNNSSRFSRLLTRAGA